VKGKGTVFSILILLVSVLGRAQAAGDVPCLVKPQVVVSIGSPVHGVLAAVLVDQGDIVKEGQVVAALESSFEQAEVSLAKGKAEMEAPTQNAQVKMEYSARKLARVKDLRKRSAMAEHEVDEAEAEALLAKVSQLEARENKRIAELELERAQAALALRTIRSPISGIVVERYLFPGELIRESTILKLAQLDPLRIEASAPLSLFGRVKPGMPAEIRMDGSVQGIHHARVVVVNPVIETASGTFAIRLELPNPQYTIPAGQTCTVRIRPE
jgi:RND family efflux transporter MFP subunit